MAHVLADRILETTSSTGLGAYRLQGPRPGYAAFASVMLPGDTCHYTATDNLQWEIGLATLLPDGPSLARTQILRSSHGEGLPIAWPPAPRAIFLTVPAAELAALRTLGGSDPIDLSGRADGALLTYAADLNTWIASNVIRQQLMDGGNF